MKIKLIGADTKNGIKIIKNMKKLERDLNITFNVELISGQEKNKYHIKEIPTLIIDNKITSVNYVPTERELRNILKPVLEN